jgi:integrase
MGRPRKHQTHLPPCVYKSHGAYFLVKRGRWELLGHDLSNALAEYGRRLEEPKGGCSELIDAAFDAMKRREPPLARNTLDQYAIAARRLKAILREFAPSQVKPKHVAAIKLKLAATPNMTNRLLSFGRQVFDFALENQLIDANPFVGIKRHFEQKRERLISQNEFDAIYAHAGPRLQAIMDLLFLTAQRIEDVLNVRLRDVTDEGIAFKQRKTGVRLVVRWSPELRAVVDRAKSLGGNVRALTLLQNRRGKAPDYRTVLAQWHRARRLAGVEDATPHDLRAMALTAMEKQGGAKAAQAVAGHTSGAQTARYLRARQVPVVDGPTMPRVLGAK